MLIRKDCHRKFVRTGAISELDDPKWNHNNCYYNQLINLIPDNVDTCLEIGCGKGEFAFLLSKKSKRVIAVDIADKMIEKAKFLHSNDNIEYFCENILHIEFENNSLDAIVTIATAHHLPFEWLLNFAKDILKKGGKLIIQTAKISRKLFWRYLLVWQK